MSATSRKIERVKTALMQAGLPDHEASAIVRDLLTEIEGKRPHSDPTHGNGSETLIAVVGDNFEDIRIDIIQAIERTNAVMRRDMASRNDESRRLARNLTLAVVLFVVLQVITIVTLLWDGIRPDTGQGDAAGLPASSVGIIGFASAGSL